jgi:hypothetical protein
MHFALRSGADRVNDVSSARKSTEIRTTARTISRHWHGAGCAGFSSGWALPSLGCLLAAPRQATCELTALKASVSSAASVVSPHWTYTCVQATVGKD